MGRRGSAGKTARGLLLHAALLGVMGAATAQAPLSPVVVGKPAHDFSVALLTGQTVKLSDFRGRVLLLNFWASW